MARKLGVTYAPVLDNIWFDVEKLIDIVEIANLSYFEKILDKPWTYHFRQKDPYDRKQGSLNLLKLDEIKEALEKSRGAIFRKKPEIISVHFAYPALEIGKAPPDNHNFAMSEILPRDEVRERFLESLNYLTEFTESAGISLAVENLDYHIGGAYGYICEPEFIQEIFQRNKKLYLLLDIAHAEVSTVMLSGAKPEQKTGATLRYLKQLPLERVIEIHINAPVWERKTLLDMHSPITRAEETLLKEILPVLPNLQVVNLECERKIKWQLIKLRKAIQERG